MKLVFCLALIMLPTLVHAESVESVSRMNWTKLGDTHHISGGYVIDDFFAPETLTQRNGMVLFWEKTVTVLKSHNMDITAVEHWVVNCATLEKKTVESYAGPTGKIGFVDLDGGKEPTWERYPVNSIGGKQLKFVCRLVP